MERAKTTTSKTLDQVMAEIDRKYSEHRRNIRAFGNAAKVDPRDRSSDPRSAPRPGEFAPPQQFPAAAQPALTQARTLLAATSMKLSRLLGRPQDDVAQALLEGAAELQARVPVTFEVAIETVARQFAADVRMGLR